VIKDNETDIEAEVVDVLSMEQQLVQLETQLSQNNEFRKFIEFQEMVRAKSAEVFKRIEQVMIENDIKSVKGEWGSISLVERTNYKADMNEVPAKFIKKTLDTTKVAASHKLENKLPKGVTITTTKFLMKKFKKGEDQ
jgi:hypothetical protein